MRYLIRRRSNGEVVGSLGGYSTKSGALKAMMWRLDLITEGADFVRKNLGTEPGLKFGSQVQEYLREHFEVVGIEKIMILTETKDSLIVYSAEEKGSL